MNKQQAKQQLDKLQLEMDKLKAIIEAPEPATEKVASLLTKPVAGSGESYCSITTFGEEFRVAFSFACAMEGKRYACGNFFQTKELAENYAKAFNTFLQLRHCEGTVPSLTDKNQYFIEMDYGDALFVDSTASSLKFGYVCPAFKTAELAKKAIDTVGSTNLIHMFKTFQGVHHDE